MPIVRLTLPVLLLFSLVSRTVAQSCAHAGSLSGLVRDPTGAVLPEAQVAVLSETLTRHEVSTDGQGRWSVRCLPTGNYRIEVTAPGFRNLVSTVRLKGSGDTANLTSSLQLETVDQSVDAAADSKEVASGGANILGSNQLRGLADDPDDLQRQLQYLAAAAGGQPGKAIITVDGFQSATALPPKASIQDVNINPDLFSAQYASPPYAGGRIEVFTKAGQDKFHGALFGAIGSHIWNANDPLAVSKTPANKQRIGFELSGPLLPNKHADFALNLDHRSIDENAVVNAYVLSSADLPAMFNQSVATPQRLWQGNARAGFQLNSKDSLALSFAANSNNKENSGVGGLSLLESGYSSHISEYSLRAINSTFFTSALLHSTRVGLSWKTTEQDPNSTSTELEVAGAFTGGGSIAGQLHSQERDLEFDDETYLTLKRHTIKAGVQLLGTFIADRNPNGFNGAFTFGGGNAQVLDSSGNPTGATTVITGLEQYRRAILGLPGGNPTTYAVTTGNTEVPLDQWAIAAYAQEDWRVRNTLLISAGLRYFSQTAPTIGATFAPRIGFAFSFGKKQQWTMHARTGLFYLPIGPSASLETVRLDGVRQQSATVYLPSYADPLNASSPIFEQRRFSSGIGISPSSQSQLSLEHSLFNSWSVSANVYYTASWGVLRSINANAPLLSQNMASPAAGPRPIAPNLNLFEYGRTGRYAGPFAFIGVNHFGHSFSVISGYLYAGFRSNADSINTFPESSYAKTRDWARPSGSVTHNVFAVVIYSLPYKIDSTTNLSISSGAAYDVTTGFDNNGDGVFNDRPSQVTTSGPGVYATRFGLLSTNVTNGDLQRNIGTMPANFSLDLSLSRSFVLKEGRSSRIHQQVLKFDARSANLLNHPNYTAVDGIVGSQQFSTPLSADFGRRIEFGARISF